jgi:hypothetical protein
MNNTFADTNSTDRAHTETDLMEAKERKKLLQGLFDVADQDDSGALDIDELRQIMPNAEAFLAAVGTSQDGVISMEEFKKWSDTNLMQKLPAAHITRLNKLVPLARCGKRLNNGKKVEPHDLFNALDVNRDSELSLDEIESVFGADSLAIFGPLMKLLEQKNQAVSEAEFCKWCACNHGDYHELLSGALKVNKQVQNEINNDIYICRITNKLCNCGQQLTSCCSFISQALSGVMQLYGTFADRVMSEQRDDEPIREEIPHSAKIFHFTPLCHSIYDTVRRFTLEVPRCASASTNGLSVEQELTEAKHPALKSSNIFLTPPPPLPPPPSSATLPPPPPPISPAPCDTLVLPPQQQERFEMELQYQWLRTRTQTKAVQALCRY